MYGKFDIFGKSIFLKILCTFAIKLERNKKRKIMTTVELNHIRTQIIRMICDENNEKLLNEVEHLLTRRTIPFEEMPCCYSSEELKQRVCQATASIRAGQGYTTEEMKTIHPRQA